MACSAATILPGNQRQRLSKTRSQIGNTFPVQLFGQGDMSKNKQHFFRAPRELPKIAKPPHIVVSILGGRERQNWHLPELTTEIIRMVFGTASGRYKLTWAPMNNV